MPGIGSCAACCRGRTSARSALACSIPTAPCSTPASCSTGKGWRSMTGSTNRRPRRAGPALAVTRAVSAVDGAFLAIRRETFLAHGGFDAAGLPIAHSDIDLALKLRSSGLKILWTPHVTLRHFESKTRGLDHLDPEKAARNRAERRLLIERWGAALTGEPSLNPFWHQA